MQQSELKLITASNLIKLRTSAGMTQAELGAELNYSDKTVSKWERGEAIPDAYVLTQLAEKFGVTVDQLLSPCDTWVKKTEEETSPGLTFSADVLIALSATSVMAAVIAVFVIVWLCGTMEWRLLLLGVPLALLTALVLNCVFKRGENPQFIIAVLVLSVFIALYFFIPNENPWQLALLLVPCEAIVFLSCNIRKRPRFRRKKKTETPEQ